MLSWDIRIAVSRYLAAEAQCPGGPNFLFEMLFSKLDGTTAPERLTPNVPGTHSYTISPNGEWAFHSYSSFDVPPAFAEERRGNPLIHPPPGNLLRRVAETKQVIQVADAAASGATLSLARLASARSRVCRGGSDKSIICDRTRRRGSSTSTLRSPAPRASRGSASDAATSAYRVRTQTWCSSSQCTGSRSRSAA